MSTGASSPTTLARDVDVRGFVYALEPLRQRQQWRLDKSMASLAQAQQTLMALDKNMKLLLDAHDQQADALGRGLSSRLDPLAHRRALGYLAHLRDRWSALDAQRQTQQLMRDALRQECLDHQMRLEGLTRHKEDALTEHAHEVRQRSLSEQDRDWLARLPKTGPGSDLGPGSHSGGEKFAW